MVSHTVIKPFKKIHWGTLVGLSTEQTTENYVPLPAFGKCCCKASLWSFYFPTQNFAWIHCCIKATLFLWRFLVLRAIRMSYVGMLFKDEIITVTGWAMIISWNKLDGYPIPMCAKDYSWKFPFVCVIYRHFQETQHTYSLELGTQRVWDYTGGTVYLYCNIFHTRSFSGSRFILDCLITKSYFILYKITLYIVWSRIRLTANWWSMAPEHRSVKWTLISCCKLLSFCCQLTAVRVEVHTHTVRCFTISCPKAKYRLHVFAYE